MPKQMINSFNAGELSTNLYGRTDLEKYFSGCKTLENFIPLPYGGVERRSGFEYIASTKSNGIARLVGFQFNVEQAYVLEFGEEYIRVYKEGAIVNSAPSTPLEVVTPYQEEDLNELSFIQSNDVLFIAHGDYPPAKLSRTSDTSWTYEVIEFEGGPFLTQNDTDITLTASYPLWLTATDYKKDQIVYQFSAGVVFDNAAAVDKGNGLVGIPCTGHGIIQDSTISIDHTTNYDGVYIVNNLTTTNEIVIRATFVAETFDGSNDLAMVRTHFKCLADHTSTSDLGLHPQPLYPNTTDWAEATYFSGDNVTITASEDVFDADHEGALFELRHPRNDNSLHGDYQAAISSLPIRVLGTWNFITHSTWSAVVEIWRSYDDGQTWNSYRYYSGTNDRNVIDSGTEDIPNALYKVVVTKYNTGTVAWDFSIRDYENVGVVKINTVTTAKIAVGEVVSSFGELTPTKRWAEGAWSDYRGWPSQQAFFEERFCYAGSAYKPQTIWLSKTNLWNDFTAGVIDNDAIALTIAHDQVNSIKWLKAHKELLIGTSGGEWRLGGGSDNEPITPSSISMRIQSTYGSSSVQAKVVNSVILFVSRNNRKVRELVYNFERDGYISPDMTRLSDHITGTGLLDVAYQQAPESILWCVRTDGTLIGMSYEREESVVAWHKHDVDGSVESIAVLQGTDEDEVYVIVNRTIDGGTVRYIERKRPQYFEDIEDCFFVDSGVEIDNGLAYEISAITKADPALITITDSGTDLDDMYVRISGVVGMTEVNDAVYHLTNTAPDTYSLQNDDNTADMDSSGWTTYDSEGTALVVQNTVDNLDYLEGEEVAIFADGATHTNKTVASGEIDLDRWCNRIVVGLPYTSTLVPMEIESESQDGGTGQGSVKRVSKLTIRLNRSVHCKVGQDTASLNTVYFRTPGMNMGSGIELFTGDKELSFSGGYTKNATVMVVQDLPLPLKVTALIADIQTTR